ncbi:hypothetical protein [Anianabacter salinae]|uniref:hypothetical protein n=1 Tax=Anianabacter salinae TaxID=2851023 RepID=UPI00225DDDB5|nr:hypothetical protein [Anianabacter salinae]MBV0911798.1 hypothetical protein [Anianabacter salinae]
MTHLTRPLSNGQPVTLWRHSPVTETPWDVADQPMQGEMDPFFFLTKEKNFIPHEYPCRTEFAATYRGHAPEERATGACDTVWLGFGSPRLDLSGFWFRPTRIAASAETWLQVSQAGRATLRLATCGGAILRVNGTQVLTMSDYKRNFETMAEVALDLPAGEVHIALYLDDLAERDTRFYAQLDYRDGPGAVQAIPAPEGAAAVEATLDAMHFTRPAHMGGTLAVTLPAPLPFAAKATARIAGDFMSHDTAPVLTADVTAGADSIDFGPVGDLPADFRQIEVTLSVDGFAATRIFGTEIAHDHGAAAATLQDRITEALQAVATHGEHDTVGALARLALGIGDDTTRAMIEVSLPRIDACWDCADFALVPLIVARTKYADLLGDLCARIDETILGYRYWMDEPGNDVQWYFSENHALLFHTAAHLGGALLPDATFRRSGRSGADQSQVGADRLHAWFDHFEAWEMAEFNSAPYFPIDLKGLTAIQALSPDATLRDRAGKGIARLVELVANSAHKGVLTAAQGRSYEHSLRSTMTLELSAIGRMLWGTGSYGSRFHALPGLALCLRDHGLDLPDLTARADWQGDDAQEWAFAQGQDRIAKLYHHKTADTALGSAVTYRWYDWGYQETLIHARIGTDPNAQVWITHPGELIHSGYGRPSYWGGSASVPRVQQYRDLALVRFAGHPVQPPFTHAWFPRAAFDDAQVKDDTATAQGGDGHLMLKGSAAFEEVTTGPSANSELRLPGRDGWWLVRLGCTALHGDADAFRVRFETLSAAENGDVIVVDDADYGKVSFHASGLVEAEGRRIDPAAFTVAGERTVLPRGALAR